MSGRLDACLDPERLQVMFDALTKRQDQGVEATLEETKMGGNAGKNKAPRTRGRHEEEPWFENRRKANRKRNKMQKKSRQKNR